MTTPSPPSTTDSTTRTHTHTDLCQASLSLMGAVSEWLCHHGSSSSSSNSSGGGGGHSGASHSKPVNTHEHDGGPISPSSSSSPLARSVPWKWRIVLGICLTGNVYFTNLASLLLTYPVQVRCGDGLRSASMCVTKPPTRATHAHHTLSHRLCSSPPSSSSPWWSGDMCSTSTMPPSTM